MTSEGEPALQEPTSRSGKTSPERLLSAYKEEHAVHCTLICIQAGSFGFLKMVNFSGYNIKHHYDFLGDIMWFVTSILSYVSLRPSLPQLH